MKIKSIKEIKNIGTFVNLSNGAPFRFDDNPTFIYGLNTFGKTTLADIFQSLKDNDPKIINLRKTIPAQQESQKVVFSIKENGSEKDLAFQNNSWGQNNLSINIEVFGTEFIHRNLFTGLSIERENKENFTDFILGEEGVKIAENIENDKKTLGEKSRNRKNKLPGFIKEKSETEIGKFLKLDISNLDKNKIESDLLKLKTEKQEEEKRLQRPQKILNLQNPTKVIIPEFTILENLEKINDYLQKNYSNIKEKFLQSLNEHINKNSLNQNITENWIKQGFYNTKDKNGDCLFCGQSLTNAKDIMDLYDKYFDENYSNYITEIETGLETELKNIESAYFNFQIKFITQFTNASKFKELILDQSFQNSLNNFEKKLKNINDDSLETKKKALVQDIKQKVEQKNKKPYISIDKISFDEFKNSFKAYLENLSEINNLIEQIDKNVNNFKEQYKDTSKITLKINELKKSIEDLEYKKARIDQNEDCKIYLKEIKEIEDLDKKIEGDRKKLQGNQDEYLKKYFVKINDLFKRFGSHNFELEKNQENLGNKPVYTLRVKFHNKEISNEQMKSVFSESDRRALALSIFWAKIELKEDVEQQKTVIILDDPITSFDDNRTMNFIYFIKDNLQKLSQIIILTHYNKFLSDYNKFTEEKPKTFKIIKGGKLDNFDLDTFLKSEYTQTLEKIDNFINGNTVIDPAVFRSFIDILYRPIFSGITPDKIISDLYQKCCTFNHNGFNYEQEEENVRNFAREMRKKLYSFEYKQVN